MLILLLFNHVKVHLEPCTGLACCEGLVIKRLSSDAAFLDSLDLVPTVAYYGRGGRQRVSAAHFSLPVMMVPMKNSKAYAHDFLSKLLEQCSVSLHSKVIPKPKVWEVKVGGLTISLDHCAAIGIVDPIM
ncbi:hypothetical protein GH714_017279 [Hevea brasiliensis]|uniref:Uncharacterized protein n=1 Tax=Hevea brasiliensis TaxID=3981 RepID=A0A6A6KSD2_HEVBR|nr:hypothetical protein GH714_017279 [Hevea brasiliensis]